MRQQVLESSGVCDAVSRRQFAESGKQAFLIDEPKPNGWFLWVRHGLELVVDIYDAMDGDLAALWEQADVFALSVQRDQQPAQGVLLTRKQSNVINVAEIPKFRALQIEVVEIRQNDFRKQPRRKRPLGNAMAMEDPLVGRGPCPKPVRELVAEIRIKTQLGKEVAQNAVIQTVVARSQIETRRVDEPVVDGLVGRIIESRVSGTPFAIEPCRRLAGVHKCPKTDFRYRCRTLGNRRSAMRLTAA